jgi:molybdopterin molybdotransferase
MTPIESTRDMLGREKLSPVTAARSLLLSKLQGIRPGNEAVSLRDALDRITAADIFALEDLPPRDRSTMDGFAVIAADTFGASQSVPAYVHVTGEVEMGFIPDGTITRGNCYRIPTGGVVPDGSDAVVMFEHTVPVDDKMIEIVKGVGSGSNIIRRGDDISRDNLALPAGCRLRPSDLGLLAGLGIAEVDVFKQISVGIISTGDEIIDHCQPLTPGKIRNINSVTTGGLIRRCGAKVHDYGIVKDTEVSFFNAVERAVAENDLVIFSGGSSVGVRDLGEQAIERLGSPGILVHGVSLKPGKPVIIGLTGATPVFGLPGHPVSAMVCFDLFVKPAILSLSGINQPGQLVEPVISARLMRNINSAAGRLDLVRVQLVEENGEQCAYPVLGRSGAISTMSRSNGYFLITENSQGALSGDPVEVYPYQ